MISFPVTNFATLILNVAYQELFSKQKGYLDEELDYRKLSMDQAHKVIGLAFVLMTQPANSVLILS